MHSRLLLFAIASTVGGAAASAAPGDYRAVARSVVSFVNAVNEGHEHAALGHFTDDVSIVEDLAPYRWQGPHAGAEWLEAMFRNGQKMGVSEILMHLGNPKRVEVTGDRAYEVIPGVVTLKGKGRSLRESGSLTFALRKEGADWKIAAFSWSGERAH